MSDEDIIEAMKTGGQARDEALKHLYCNAELRVAIKSTLSRFGAQLMDIQDIFQDALIQFDRNLIENKFKGDSSIKTYIISISKFKWLNAQKKARKVDFVPLEDNRIDQQDLEHPEFQLLEQESESLDGQLKQVLETLLLQLDSRCQKALRMWSEGQSMEQIKIALDFKERQGASNKTHRCRERLRKLISADPVLSNFLKSRL